MLMLHALFEPRIKGDDALLRLAARRFEEFGLAAEIHARSRSELDRILGFVPEGPRTPVVHLPRDVDLLDAAGRELVTRIVARAGERVSGFVVHDQPHLPERLPELTQVADQLSAVLAASGHAMLFIEYAVGLLPEQYAAVGDALRDVERVGLCIDTGHVGVRQAGREFNRLHPEIEVDLVAMDVWHPELPGLVEDVQTAVASGLATVLELTQAVAIQGKPAHFHLHDGHPLVQGLADHYGFLTRLPIPFRHRGLTSLDPLFGVPGLSSIISTINQTLGPERSTITLEIHEHTGRLPLPAQDAAQLFSQWHDLANAERMNFWLRELGENATLVRSCDLASRS
jgi:hypothetical protein